MSNLRTRSPDKQSAPGYLSLFTKLSFGRRNGFLVHTAAEKYEIPAPSGISSHFWLKMPADTSVYFNVAGDQTFSTYSRIVRSAEKLPMLATFNNARSAHCVGFAKSASTFVCVAT